MGNGFSQFPNIFGSFENSFNHRNFKQNHQNIDDDETFKEFEESQHFLDFMPKIWSFFKGNGSSEDNKKNEFQKRKNFIVPPIDFVLFALNSLYLFIVTHRLLFPVF